MLTWGLHLCAVNFFFFTHSKNILFSWLSSYAGIYQKHLQEGIPPYHSCQWREWLHPDGGLKNWGITQTLRLEETFGDHQVTAELTVKLDQALKGFLTFEITLWKWVSLFLQKTPVTTEGTQKNPKWTAWRNLGKSRPFSGFCHVSLMSYPFHTPCSPLQISLTPKWAFSNSYNKRRAVSWNDCSIPFWLYSLITLQIVFSSFLKYIFSLVLLFSLPLTHLITFPSLFLTESIAHYWG